MISGRRDLEKESELRGRWTREREAGVTALHANKHEVRVH